MGDVSYNLCATYTKDVGKYGPANNDNLSLSFPLGSKPRAPRAFVSASTKTNNTSTQVGIDGYLSQDSDTHYSVQGGNSSTGGCTGSANLSTRTSVMDINAGYSQERGYNSQNFNVVGSIVGHAGGINFG